MASDDTSPLMTLPRTGIVSIEIFDVVLDDSAAKSQESIPLSSSHPLLRHDPFRQLLEERLEEYISTPKLQQPLVTLQVLETWRSKSPGGRFLKFDSQKQVWSDIGDKKAREQIGKAFRIILKESSRRTSASSSSDVPRASSSSGSGYGGESSRDLRSSLSQQESSVSNRRETLDVKIGETGTQNPPALPPPKRTSPAKRIASSFIRKNGRVQILCGRSADHERLVQLYQQSISRSSNHQNTSDQQASGGATHLLIISGAPGVGKTSLALSLEPRVMSHNGFFVTSKFSEVRPHLDPMSPYKVILQDIVRVIMERKNNLKWQQQLCQKIIHAAGEELKLLMQVVPAIHQLENVIAKVAETEKGNRESHGSSEVLDQSIPLEQSQTLLPTAIRSHVSSDFLKEQATPVGGITSSTAGPTNVVGTNTLSVRRFEYAFQKVLKALASPEHPLVILLDDVQGALMSKSNNVNEQAVELASSARTTGGLFFIMTYRLDTDHLAESTEVLNNLVNHPLPNIRSHHLALTGLTKEALQELLVDAVALEATKLETMTQTVSDLTKGNVLFVLEILRILQEDDLLRYDEAQNQWMCDEHLLRQHSIIQVRSLRDLYRLKMMELPPECQEILQVCACFGQKFRDDILKLVANDGICVDTMLQIFLDQGFFSTSNDQGRECYSFCHDSIQQAAYQLIPKQDRESWHLKIGQRLWNKTADDEKLLESVLFAILEQLFVGEALIQDSQDRIKVASLCLHAGEVMAKSSGFDMAFLYSEKGIALLGPKKWRKHNTYDLCLALFNNAIDTGYATGRIDRVEKLIQEVRENARVADDELRARIMLIYTLGTKRELKPAIDLGVETLSQLGEKMLRYPSKVHVIWEVMKTRRMLHHRSDNSLRRLPVMTDERLISIQLVLNVMFLSTYYSEPLMAAQLSCRMVQLTVEKGVSNVSCVGLAMFAIVVLGGGFNLEEAKRYSVLAFHFADRFGGETWLSRISVALYGLVNIWLKPMSYCLEKLKHAYQVGLGGGDMEFAMVNASIYLWNNLDRLPTYELEAHARNLTERMEFLGQEKAAFMLRPLWQICLNFMGKAHGDPSKLTGSVLEEEDIENVLAQGGRRSNTRANASYYKLIVAYHFGDFAKATSCCSLVRPTYLTMGTVMASMGRLYEALSLLETLKRQGLLERHRRLRLIREHISMFRYWCQYSPENHMGKLCLVQAELARYEDKKLKAQSKYYCAIVHARDGGILLEHALANERAGKYQLELGKTTRASEMLQEACRLYKEWGGIAKVDHLAKEVGHLVELQFGH